MWNRGTELGYNKKQAELPSWVDFLLSPECPADPDETASRQPEQDPERIALTLKVQST